MESDTAATSSTPSYVGRVARSSAVLLAATVCACGSAPHDHSRLFVHCLIDRGGSVVTRTAQLSRVPGSDPQTGTSAALKSIIFMSIDMAARHGRRQALVILDPPVPTPDSTQILRQVRSDPRRFRAVVLMPARKDWDPPISRCMDVAAPGEAFP